MNIRNRIRGAVSAVICAIAMVAAFCMQPAARAQASRVSTVNIISAGTLTNSATWSPSTIVRLDGQTMCGLGVRFQGDGSATSDVVTTVYRSFDGVNFETTPPSTMKFTNALNNTTAVIGHFQIPRDLVGSCAAVKITIQNTASSVKGTNATVFIAKKAETP